MKAARNTVKVVDCTCTICGTQFKQKPYRIYAKNFCSPECRTKYENRHKGRYCLYCKVPFRHWINIFCSPECRDKMYAETKNPMHRSMSEQWRGPGWPKQKALAYTRDKGVCQVCGFFPSEKETRNAVHHIKPFREFNGDYISANALENLITTCKHCHAKLEHILVVPIKFKDAYASIEHKPGRKPANRKETT